MSDLLNMSPSAGSHGAEPFSAAEIDSHPDCDRIWATISSLREGAEGKVEEAESQAKAKILSAAGAAIKATATEFFKVADPAEFDDLFAEIGESVEMAAFHETHKCA